MLYTIPIYLIQHLCIILKTLWKLESNKDTEYIDMIKVPPKSIGILINNNNIELFLSCLFYIIPTYVFIVLKSIYIFFSDNYRKPNIEKPTVSRIVKRNSCLLCLKMRHFVKFPTASTQPIRTQTSNRGGLLFKRMFISRHF